MIENTTSATSTATAKKSSVNPSQLSVPIRGMWNEALKSDP